MQKIQILTTRDRILQVTGKLQSLGAMEITNFRGKKKLTKKYREIQSRDTKTIEYRLAQAEFFESFLSQSLSDEKNNRNIKLPEYKSYEVQHYFDWALVDRAQNIRDELVKIDNDSKGLQEEKELLEPWTAIDIPLHSIGDTRETIIRIGSISRTQYEGFVQQLAKISSSYIREAKVGTDKVITMVIAHRDQSEELDKLLSGFNFSIIELPKRRGTPREEIERIERRLRKLQQNKKKLLEAGREMAQKHLNSARVLVDELHNKKLRHDEALKYGHTHTVSIIQGWVPQNNVNAIKKAILNVAPASVVQKIHTSKEDEPPVTIHNNKAVEPCESVTSLYGMPLYHELDPTPWLAVFFIVFFGFCLTDAGYGIMLTLISLATIKFGRKYLEEGALKLLKLMAIGGVSTFILGALFGGWFGINFDILPSWAQKVTLINPLDNPMTVLVVTLIIGVVHLYVGYLVRFIHLLRHKEYREAILGQLPWLLFFLAGGAWIASAKAGLMPELADLTQILALAAIGFIVVGNGFKDTLNPLRAIPTGVLALWGIVGFVSDVLSYSRLLALGLATGIIAMVINLVASVAIDMIGPIGYVLAFFILIGGHLFNLAINVLGAFIHSSRLQFVEFFSKFMEGGGRLFAPFRKENKWVVYE